MDFYLNKIKSKEDLKRFFIEQWGWDNPSISGGFFDITEEIKDFVAENNILAEKMNVQVLYFELTNLTNPEKQMKPLERRIIASSKIKDSIANSLFVFSVNGVSGFDFCDFVKAEKIGAAIKIKRFSINPENRNKLRTTQEQLAKLKMETVKLSPSYVKNQIEAAFSVEEITEKFYDDYIAVFQKIKKNLQKQKVEVENEKQEEKLRDFIHQILNRLMFLCFVQKRGCFAGDKDFLANFWDKYKENHSGENKFYSVWLSALFFEALNQPSFRYSKKKELGDFNSILQQAPYLNGGLFEKSDLDKVGWQIADGFFEDIFDFLQGYNFTIEESTPLDIDIAINPEMLGNIYEHLVNVEEAQEQAKAGIFYTPKTEIDLMIKRALVEFLFGKTSIGKEKLFLFIFNPEEIAVLDKNEARAIFNSLNEILILDPACGSGHYLVVCSQTLYSLKLAIREFLGEKPMGKYQAKKDIIEKNLYGNDIKPWAANVAKLRLWLDLFVDAQDEFLQNQAEPLLPNLGFKIRHGDSLLQELAGEIIPLRKIGKLFASRRADLKNLIAKKRFVYKKGAVKDFEETLYLEKNLLQQILSRQKDILEKKKQHLSVEGKKATGSLFGDKAIRQKSLFGKEIAEIETSIASVIKLKEALCKMKEPPMLWELAFAEVFAIKNGFDIVIANPPYVRQEQICDLNGIYQKSDYKSKLIEQMQTDWSYNSDGEPYISRINKFNKKSDLYVYFYFKSLKLLNPQGVLCFITSNSWLDVGYGGFLQEILLKNCPVVAIYDNQAKRSFKHADVNTIISLLKAPSDKQWSKEIQANEPRFVMFKKSFEEIVSPEIFIEIESQSDFKKYPEGERKENEIFRLHKASQKQLFEYGLDKDGKEYKGNKWGGKYLRSPEIYWTILEKGKGKLVDFDSLVEDIQRNNLQNLTKIEIIDENYKKNNNLPFLHSLKDIKGISVDINDLPKCIKKRSEKDIKFLIPDIISNRFVGERMFYIEGGKFLVNDSFFVAILKKEYDRNIVLSLLNSSPSLFFMELFGRKTYAVGVLYIYGPEFKKQKLLNPDIIENRYREKLTKIYGKIKKREIRSIFEEYGINPKLPIHGQEPKPLPDRKALDDIVFDVLGLTEQERKEVYWAVAELVQNRLSKAKNV